MFKFIKTGFNAIFGTSPSGEVFNFNESHPKYEVLVKAMQEENEEVFLQNLNIGKLPEKWSCGEFKLVNGQLMFKDIQLNGLCQEIIFKMIEEGEDYRPMLRFLHNTYQNTQNLSDDLYEMRINSLFRFLQNKNLSITPDGYFLAYKYVSIYQGEATTDVQGNTLVKGDYVDTHTKKTHRNNIGDKPFMSIEGVNKGTDVCAGAGLHVGSLSYMNMGQDAGVIVKVHPSHVVVVPHADAEKVRCTGYEVVAKYDKPLESTVEREYVEDDDDWDEDDYQDNYDYYACQQDDFEDEDCYEDEDECDGGYF